MPVSYSPSTLSAHTYYVIFRLVRPFFIGSRIYLNVFRGNVSYDILGMKEKIKQEGVIPKMSKKTFVHLHVHTEYSLLDGMCKIKPLVKKIKDSGMTACAITDHGVGCGLVEFYDECKAQGIKPILGCEFYEAPSSRFEKTASANEKNYHHLILLVKNETGYKNLCRLISRSNIEGFYHKPRIDFELMEQYHEGLVCLSACLAGRVPRMILKGSDAEIEQTILKYKKLFQEDYYLEIQNHGIREEEIVAQGLVRMSRKLGIKLVCTNDCHYVNSDDSKAHEWLVCMQTKKKLSDDDRMRYYGDYSVKTEAEMRSLFPSLPEAFDNTAEVADKCNFDFTFGNYRMPAVPIPEEYGTDYFRYLEDETWKGWNFRYPEGHPEREEAKRDVQYELGIVKQMGFAEYFLDTRKTIKFAKDHHILVGPGRGSAAGSRMCYCLEITDLDPIPYKLLFERFLNPERVSMPDIDTDFDESHKDEIIAFEAQSNGWDHFSKIQTFTAMNAKEIVRDVARVAGEPVSTGNQLASFIPEDPGVTLEKAWEVNAELRDFIQSSQKYEEMWQVALKLEGTKKAASTHACGHIPTPVPCEELFPVSVDAKSGYLVCQYNMTDAERLGNLKKDLLMLRNLTIIDIAQKAVYDRKGVTIPLWSDEILNDQKALELIASGNTNGVFQLESDGMKDFMKRLKPSSFEDIVAGVALYRPGPMDYIDTYIKGKQNPSSIVYLTPELEDILAPTYGVIVYQEQVMQIVQKLAGFSLGRADVVRKGMAKKKQYIMDEERPHFIYGDETLQIEGCIKHEISEDVAVAIWDQMVDFAKYAFNKSHAAVYAAISMQTAYLKAHYPLEFASGLLTSVTDKTKKLAAYVNEYRKNRLKILPPDVNSSGMTFTVVGNAICYGMSAIKNVGKDALKQILDERDLHGLYSSYSDFILRNYNSNKKTLESLIKAGALGFTGLTRRTMLEALPRLLDAYKKENKIQCEGQLSLFEFLEEGTEERNQLSEMTIPLLDEYEDMVLLDYEKEVTGLYISRHPMDMYTDIVRKNGVPENRVYFPDEETGYHPIGMNQGYVSGIITSLKIIYTKKDGRPMAFMELEDQTAVVDVVVFPKQFEQYGNELGVDRPLILYGKIDRKEEKLTFLAENIYFLDEKELCVQFQTLGGYLNLKKDVTDLINRYKGTKNLHLYLREEKKQKVVTNAVSLTEECLDNFRFVFGKENIALKRKDIYLK